MAGNNVRLTRERRALLGNPYAHINGDGQLDGTTVGVAGPGRSANVRFTSQDPYAYIDAEGRPESTTPEIKPAEPKQLPPIRIDEVLGGYKPGSAWSVTDIENCAVRMQRLLWSRREAIMGHPREIAPLELLEPDVALRSIGIDVVWTDTLGQFTDNGETFDIAGVFDRDTQEISLATLPPPSVRRFTAAHELGHALLHTGTGMHRDRALDGGAPSARRSQEEMQADIFAACFLMPKKQVHSHFRSRFLTAPFKSTVHTLTAFSAKDRECIGSPNSTQRQRSLTFARAEFYNGVHFVSLASQFVVSETAMAIRLEELKLV